MDISSRRPPLKKGRRIALNVNISPETHRALGKISNGNRSAAIETLVRQHLDRATAANCPGWDRAPYSTVCAHCGTDRHAHVTAIQSEPVT
jgi:hypothetical protein